MPEYHPEVVSFCQLKHSLVIAFCGVTCEAINLGSQTIFDVKEAFEFINLSARFSHN
jgi:hypothetical protein